MTKSVAILGCGPAGLMVAHAAQLSNWSFNVYSKRQKSTLHGAQYLHKPIPGIDTYGPHQVKYILRGRPDQYRHKVYGRFWEGAVSPEDYPDDHSAWDLRRAYDWLWKQYESVIHNCEITSEWAIPVPQSDLVISTIPRKIWAEDGDIFNSQKIWALGDSDPHGGFKEQADFTVLCDGTREVDWYRAAKIFGHSTLEWPYKELWEKPPWRGAVIVEKPLWHNSKAASDFIHLGRYGAWEKGILTSDVFYQAMRIFADDTIG